MKRIFTVLTFLSLASLCLAQEKSKKIIKNNSSKSNSKAPAKSTENSKKEDVDDGGYDIKLTMTPAKNQKAYLACYYGKGNALIDSCQLDENCMGHFRGKKKLTGGIYFVVSQAYAIQEGNLLIGDDQHFTVVGDTTKKNQFVITGSKDNDLFKIFSKKTQELGSEIEKVIEKLKTAKTKADSTPIIKEYKEKELALSRYKNQFAKEHDGTLIAALLNAMKIPEQPEVAEGDSIGRMNAFYYIRDNYFNDMSFDDARLLRTPFFEKKVDDYFKSYVSTDADSIYPQVYTILKSTGESKEMYAYLLTKFTNKYMNPEFMGQDKVFVEIFKEFYLKGDTVLLDAKSRKTIIDRGYSLMLNIIGGVASPLDLTDTTGKVISMYSLKNKYTVVAYWSPTCGHCRTEMPSLDSIYKAKWKKLDVKIYSIISKDDELSEMKKFIAEKNLSNDWIYTYETKEAKLATEKAGVPNFRQAYDFQKTPVLYLLDKDKRILTKNLTIEQMDKFLEGKTKSEKS